MSGGPACAVVAIPNEATKSATANRGERIWWRVMNCRTSLRDVSTFRRQDGRKQTVVNNSLGVGRALGPIAFVGAPQVDVAEAEGVPPGVEHGAVEAEDAVASYGCGWRSERGEAIIDTRAIGFADAGKQMPESER